MGIQRNCQATRRDRALALSWAQIAIDLLLTTSAGTNLCSICENLWQSRAMRETKLLP